MAQTAAPLAAQEPVIPDFGQADSCSSDVDTLFCWGWVREHWGTTLAPRLLEHIEICAVGVACGSAIALVAAWFAYEHGWFEQPFVGLATVLYTIPALAFLQLLVPLTGLGRLTMYIALSGYTLVAIFRNTLAGLREVSPEILLAATSGGMTRRQTLLKVAFPLALPSVIAGIRVASVTAISAATIGAYVAPLGLGDPILTAIRNDFNTQLIAGGSLAIILALVADGSLRVLQHLMTPWLRVGVR